MPDPSWTWRLATHAYDLDADGHDTVSAFVLTVQDEGTPLATGTTTINFVGSGVVATGTGATKTITITGFSGGLDDLSDVTITSVANAQRLRYSTATNLWENSSLVWESMIASDGSVMTDGLLNPMQHEVPY